MHRQTLLDLGYTHEIHAPPSLEALAPAASTGRASDLTSRLRCLKALYDLEHDRRVETCESRVEPRRRAH